MILTEERSGEVQHLRAGLVWALLRALEPFPTATDEHLHTGVWFVERHVGVAVELEDFTTAAGAHHAPYSLKLADAIAALEQSSALYGRDEWGRLQRTPRRTSCAAHLPGAWLILRPAAAMVAHHIGSRSSRELGQLVTAISALVARTPAGLVDQPTHIRQLANDLLEQTVGLALAGRPEAGLVRRACKDGGTARGRVGQLYGRGHTPAQIAATTGRARGDVQADLTALLDPLAVSYHAHVALLAHLDPTPSAHRPVGSQPALCRARPDLVAITASGEHDEHVATCRDCSIETDFYRVCVAAVLAPWAWPAPTAPALS